MSVNHSFKNYLSSYFLEVMSSEGNMTEGVKLKAYISSLRKPRLSNNVTTTFKSGVAET